MSAHLAISQEDIHVWSTAPDEACNPSLVEKYMQLLSEEELQKWAKFHFEKDRHGYLVTRALVRTVLSRYTGISPRGLHFWTNRFGKPSIANEHPFAGHLHFNVSHADGLILLAVAGGRSVGLDVESMQRVVETSIADQFFSKEEAHMLRLTPDADRRQRFLELWTLKESLAKALGLGLSSPLDHFRFELGSIGNNMLQCLDPTGEPVPDWQFFQFHPSGSHLAAICASRLAHPMRVWITPLIPLRADGARRAVRCLRMSD